MKKIFTVAILAVLGLGLFGVCYADKDPFRPLGSALRSKGGEGYMNNYGTYPQWSLKASRPQSASQSQQQVAQTPAPVQVQQQVVVQQQDASPVVYGNAATFSSVVYSQKTYPARACVLGNRPDGEYIEGLLKPNGNGKVKRVMKTGEILRDAVSPVVQKGKAMPAIPDAEQLLLPGERATVVQTWPFPEGDGGSFKTYFLLRIEK